MKAINKEINQGRAAMEVVRRHLQLELAAQQMSNLAAVSIAGANPTQPRIPNPLDAIELYTKSNRQVEAQVYQIPESPCEANDRSIWRVPMDRQSTTEDHSRIEHPDSSWPSGIPRWGRCRMESRWWRGLCHQQSPLQRCGL